MKIAYFCRILPDANSHDAIAYRVFHLIKVLKTNFNHKITLISFCEDNHTIGKKNEYCKKIYTISRIREKKEYIQNFFFNLFLNNKFFMKGNFFDVFYSYKMQIFINNYNFDEYDVILIDDPSIVSYLKSINKPKIITEVENYPEVYYESIKKERNLSGKLIRLYLYIRASIQEKNLNIVDVSITVTKFQKKILLEKNSTLNIKIIPFGVDIYPRDLFVKKKLDEPIIIFFGNLSSIYNQNSILELVNNIYLPVKKIMPNIKLNIIGNNPSPSIKRLENIPGISVLGYIEDLRPYISQASISILPLHSHGIKTRFFQLMAGGIPIITFPHAAKGINVIPNESIIFAENWQEFIEKTIELLNNNTLRNKIALNAIELMETEYSWEKMGNCLNNLIIESVNARKSK